MSLNKKTLDVQKELEESLKEQEQEQEQEQEMITIPKKQFDVLMKTSNLALSNMLNTSDATFTLLGEAIMHSWNIYQNILALKNEIRTKHKQDSVAEVT